MRTETLHQARESQRNTPSRRDRTSTIGHRSPPLLPHHAVTDPIASCLAAAETDSAADEEEPHPTQFDVQLKATSAPSRAMDGLHFRLSRKNYNDLVADRTTPLLLIVLELPPADADWLECTVEHLTMRRCGWWASLSGRAPTDGETTTIVIPEEQRIGASGMASLMAVARGQTHE